ncbi:hypothetical protein SDC9_134662 [bioreactor metagenome]|uniref:Uncharacterized protein n=1 Tax=bioreactor metagenome TaxID=1076179 RepID=A0A645DG57_9ZZZZ
MQQNEIRFRESVGPGTEPGIDLFNPVGRMAFVAQVGQSGGPVGHRSDKLDGVTRIGKHLIQWCPIAALNEGAQSDRIAQGHDPEWCGGR